MNILTALSWVFGTLTVLTGIFIFLRSGAEAEDPEFKVRFRRTYDGGADKEVGTRMAGAFFEAEDDQVPLRLRWKLFWFFLLCTGVALGGLHLI